MKKITFGKNISRGGKIFFSLVLTLALLLSTVVYSSAEGETATDFGGYDTKYTHVYSPMDVVDSSTTATKPSLKDYDSVNKTYDSSVWKFNVIEDDVSNLMKSINRFQNSCLTFANSSASISSIYNFYCSTASYTDTTADIINRTIQYVCEQRLEHMALGFTAPQSGTYEIAAPLKSESIDGQSFNFSVVKTDVSGNETVLQEQQWYTGQDRFCDLIVELAAGETVWLMARVAKVDTVVDIGIPQAILLKDSAVVKTDDYTTYKFRAIDYLESPATSGITYSSTYSATANVKAAWEIGYFSDSDSTKKAPYSYDNIVVPTSSEDEGKEVDATLLSAMKPYEFLYNKVVYIGLPFVKKADGTLRDATIAGAGAFYGSSTLTLEKLTSTYYSGCAEGTVGPDTNGDDAVDYNMVGGHFFRFTAPISGSATLNLNSDIAELSALNDKTTRLVVLQNNVVKYVYDTFPTESTFSIESVNAGDQITLLYYGYKKNSYKVTIGSPLVEITKANPQYATVTYDADGGEVVGEYEEQVLVGSTVTFPQAEKENAVFKGWYDEATETAYPYPRVQTVEITGDVTFTARYNYYGDITGDRILDYNDIVMYRQYLLGIVDLPDLSFSEPNANQDFDEEGNDIIDICDLVRAYKLIQEQNA